MKNNEFCCWLNGFFALENPETKVKFQLPKIRRARSAAIGLGAQSGHEIRN